jgi:hypothetical protein
MAVTFGLECLLEDEIAISVEGNHEMRLLSAWKAIMTYWFFEHALIGKRPVSSVSSLLRGYTLMKTCLDGISSALGAAVGSDVGDEGVGCLGLADLTFWHCCARCPKIVLLESGQYLATLEYVRPSKVSQLLALIESNHICFTGKPRHAW